MTKTIGIGKSHSKLILMGEHSVVYGYPAVALPLTSIQATCQVTASGQLLVEDKSDPLSTAIFTAFRYLGKEPYVTYEIESSIPDRRGLGSSAAVAIAAIRAVFDYFEQDLSQDCLERLANQAEQVAHENPSGLDVKTCLSDSAIHFVRDKGFSPLTFTISAYLVIADTGIHGKTKEAVHKVKESELSVRPHLDALGALVLKAEEHLLNADLFALGQVMTEAHAQLIKLGVSCEASDRLVDLALEKGALGSKMTGGGLGGCTISLVASKREAEKLAEALKEGGAVKTWVQKL